MFERISEEELDKDPAAGLLYEVRGGGVAFVDAMLRSSHACLPASLCSSGCHTLVPCLPLATPPTP